ncbi:hypothetical protein FA13DRAFT_1717139 [Coprinellus micaceus]|uniref:Uncharacterized protein n=1 Tax=Coprinellus micaceus TaxID=71717 RepID=A0A4Y7SHU7_COPMI|nr:hypothetical protein FA13DRAFT_1717139 [Coprinellus micaceus]
MYLLSAYLIAEFSPTLAATMGIVRRHGHGDVRYVSVLTLTVRELWMWGEFGESVLDPGFWASRGAGGGAFGESSLWYYLERGVARMPWIEHDWAGVPHNARSSPNLVVTRQLEFPSVSVERRSGVAGGHKYWYWEMCVGLGDSILSLKRARMYLNAQAVCLRFNRSLGTLLVERREGTRAGAQICRIAYNPHPSIGRLTLDRAIDRTKPLPLRLSDSDGRVGCLGLPPPSSSLLFPSSTAHHSVVRVGLDRLPEGEPLCVGPWARNQMQAHPPQRRNRIWIGARPRVASGCIQAPLGEGGSKVGGVRLSGGGGGGGGGGGVPRSLVVVQDRFEGGKREQGLWGGTSLAYGAHAECRAIRRVFSGWTIGGNVQCVSISGRPPVEILFHSDILFERGSLGLDLAQLSPPAGSRLASP